MIAAPRLHPADAVGTRLHVGDLVHWRQSRDRAVVMAFAKQGPGVLGPAVLLEWQDDHRSYWRSIFDLELTYLVPETRHERIVRLSHMRPQVVQVRDLGRGWYVAWAVIADGRAYGFAGGRGTALYLAARRAWAKSQTARPDGTWTVL